MSMIDRSKNLYTVPQVEKSGKYKVKIREKINHVEDFKKKLMSLSEDGSQTSVAKKVGIHISSISQYLKFNQIPNDELLQRIADCMNIGIEELLDGCYTEYSEHWTTTWLFKDEQKLGLKIEILEIGDLIEEMKPLQAKDISDEGIINIMIAITDQAKKDSWKLRRTNSPDLYSAEWWLEPIRRKEKTKR